MEVGVFDRHRSFRRSGLAGIALWVDAGKEQVVTIEPMGFVGKYEIC